MTSTEGNMRSDATRDERSLDYVVDRMLDNLAAAHKAVTAGTGYDPEKYSSTYSEAAHLIRRLRSLVSEKAETIGGREYSFETALTEIANMPDESDEWDGADKYRAARDLALEALKKNATFVPSASRRNDELCRKQAEELEFLVERDEGFSQRTVNAMREAARMLREVPSATLPKEVEDALRAVVSWRDGPEGPKMMFTEGAKMMGLVHHALREYVGESR